MYCGSLTQNSSRAPRRALFLVIDPVVALARLGTVARLATPATDEVARLRKVGSDIAICTDTAPDPPPIRPNARPLLNGLQRAFALGPESSSQDEFTILGIESQIDSG